MDGFYNLLLQKEQKIKDVTKRVVDWEKKKYKPDYRKMRDINGTKKGIQKSQ